MSGDSSGAGPTFDDAFAVAVRRLSAAGIPQPRLEARLLFEHAQSRGPEEDTGSDAVFGHFESLVFRRRRREPMAYLLGEREFWSLPFHVTPRTLVPRPESETVVEAALARIDDRGAALDILDLGTGCGCLLLALLHELGRARGVGVDIDTGALAIARGNAERLGLGARAQFLRGEWGTALDHPFDLVVANPPYVAHGEFHALAPEITAYEPSTALLAGTDGLACYREIVPALPRLLVAGGIAVLEIGDRQAASVTRLLADAEMRPIAVARDLARRQRCIVATRSSS